MTTFDTQIDLRRLEAIAAEVGGSESSIRASIILASAKAAEYAHKLALKDMRTDVGVSLGALRKRLRRLSANGVRADGRSRYSSAKSEKALRRRAGVWFGLDPVDAMALTPAPRETREGVRAGRRLFKGAFIANHLNGNKAVFRRRYKYDTSAAKHGLPLDRMFDDIFDGSISVITTDIFPKVANVFYAEFERAMNKYAGFFKG